MNIIFQMEIAKKLLTYINIPNYQLFSMVLVYAEVHIVWQDPPLDIIFR